MEQKKIHIKSKDYFLTKEIFSIIETNQDGLFKTSPFPPLEKIDKYYNSARYPSHNSGSKGLFSFFYRAFRALNFQFKYNSLKPFLSKGKLLDFGCGEGYFLNKMNNRGFSCYGVDPSQNNSKKLKQSAFDKQLPRLAFKTITAWHSIEHVYDLGKTIKRLYSLLSHKGILIVAVPNYNSYDAKYYKQFWAGYDVPRHLWHFDKKALREVFERNKFRLLSTRPLIIDAYYVSYLSEKYKGSQTPILMAFLIGTFSNLKAFFNKQYSSNYFVFKKN